ncbi:limonene-1,2-epoxide hydrolase family protein [Gordonia shandongensis]|uniref:limonene-1,2-epoxide hydrolase family protein n=1 Tax=Gordonia shandongensis TaxID=376351 RepID=UPI000408AC9C|nr:limonene-1,2-epoxide hydrolase family protein [Gordonia shandongensis]
MTSQKPTALVHDFFVDLAQQRIEAALSRVDEQIVYTNVGLPTVRGKRRFAAVMRALGRDRLSFDLEIRAISADDDGVVLTERIDEIGVGPFRMQFWVCGRTEVREGRITLWRDYFDFLACTRGFLRGVVGIVVPAARRPLHRPLSAVLTSVD